MVSKIIYMFSANLVKMAINLFFHTIASTHTIAFATNVV